MSQELIQKAEDRQEMITQGPLHKAFFILAGPAVAAMSADFILHLTDMIWVGRIGGAVPVAIVTSSMFSLWIIWSLMTFLTVGTVAVASRYYGVLVSPVARNIELITFPSTKNNDPAN